MAKKHSQSNDILLSDVQPEAISWLWPGRIALRKLTLIVGDPGVGKSTMLLDIAARVSRNDALPDGTSSDLTGAASVFLLSAEDGLADTIRPRLETMQADLKLIASRDSRDGLLSLPADLPALAASVKSHQAKLVIIDPIAAYLNGRINTWSDHHVRLVLAGLAELAEKCGPAVLLAGHLNKGFGKSAIYRPNGSIGFTAAARSVFLVAKNPENEDQRILSSVKNNLAPAPSSLTFEIGSGSNGAGQIVWGGESELSADELVIVAPTAGGREIDVACQFLLQELADGQAHVAAPLEQKALSRGISQRTLTRARGRLKIIARPLTFQGPWTWTLPAGAVLEHARKPIHGQNVQTVPKKTNGRL